MRNLTVTLDQIVEHPAASGVSRHGDYCSMRCVFHDDRSPSLLVYPDGFICKAAGCEKRGTLATLLDALDNGPTVTQDDESLKVNWRDILDDDNRPRDEFLRESEDAVAFPDVLAWYAGRGFDEEAVARHRLGWWRGWFVTPCFGEDGRAERVVLRSGPALGPKDYRVSPGGPGLYVPDWGLLKTHTRYLVLVFGIYDALTIATLRHPVATGLTGCQLPPRLLDGFRRRLYVLPDAEPPSERAAAHELVADLGWRGHLHILDYPTGCKDPNDFLIHQKADCLRDQLGRLCYETA